MFFSDPTPPGKHLGFQRLSFFKARAGDGSRSTARAASRASSRQELFGRLPAWLGGGGDAVVSGALRTAMLMSRLRHGQADASPGWLALYEPAGPLGRLLSAGRPAPGPPGSAPPSPLAFGGDAALEARAHAVGIAWNLALSEAWRRPLAERALPGLLEVVREGPLLDPVTRLRLVTALWHLSKDPAVAGAPGWPPAAAALGELVELLEGEVFLHGVDLLDRLCQTHGCPVAGQLAPAVWRMVTAEGAENLDSAAAIFSLLLSLSTRSATKNWLWARAGFPAKLAGLFGRLEVARSQAPGPAGFARGQLVGVLWNLAMDASPGRRAALCRALAPRLPGLLSHADPVVAGRACTAAFHLAKCPESAELLRDALLASPELPLEELPEALVARLDKEERRIHALSLLGAMIPAQVAGASDDFQRRLTPGLLRRAFRDREPHLSSVSPAPSATPGRVVEPLLSRGERRLPGKRPVGHWVGKGGALFFSGF